MSDASISFQDKYGLSNEQSWILTSLDGATYQHFVFGFGLMLDLDREKLGKFLSCAVDPALDRADGALADMSGLLVGEAGGANQNERLALIRGEVKQRLAKFPELDMPGLCFRRCQALRIAAISIFDLPTTLAIFGAKVISQDCE